MASVSVTSWAVPASALALARRRAAAAESTRESRSLVRSRGAKGEAGRRRDWRQGRYERREGREGGEGEVHGRSRPNGGHKV